MITRRTLLKFIGLLPLVGPAFAKAMIKTGATPALPRGPYLPAWFPKWDNAVDNREESSRPDQHAGRQSWRAAEIGRFPSPICLPTLTRATSFPAYAGRGKARLPHGERLRIVGLDDKEKPLHVALQPLRYMELHAQIVPEDVRRVPGYEGYELSLKMAKTIADFGKDAPQTYFNEADGSPALMYQDNTC